MDAPKDQAQQKPAETENKDQKGGERGFGRGDRKPRGDRKDRKGGDRKKDEPTWTPVTKLGRLVKNSKIDNIIDIFRFSIPIKESEIVDKFLGDKLKEEVM